MDKENYVTFIDGGMSDGVGFFVGNLFITAGHVVNDNHIHTINYNGRKIELKKSDAKYLNCSEDELVHPDIPDVAIFKLENVNSLLMLAEELPTIGQCLEIISKRRVVKRDESCGVPSIFNQSEHIESHLCKGEVLESDTSDTDYWMCFTDKILRKGDSGSPFLMGNAVYGILAGGEPETQKCVFLSAEKIIRIIKNNKIE